MYAGQQESQIQALASANQQLANELYNKKMEALARAQFFTKIGDSEERGRAIKDATRSGLSGVVKNAWDFLGGNSGNPNVETTSSYGSEFQQNEPAPTGNPKIDAVMGINSYDLAKSKVLQTKGLDDMQKAFMIADAESRKTTGKPLDPVEFKKMYSDSISYNPNVTKDANFGDLNLGDATDNSAYRNTMKDKVAQESALIGDQKVIDAENKDIALKNDKIERENKKAQAEYEAKVKKNPEMGLRQYFTEIGLSVPSEFTGDKANMRKQNYDLHNAQIEYFMGIGRKDLAKKAEREWIQNEMNIDKSWGDDGGGSYKSLWNTDGPKGEAYEEVGIAIQYDKDGDKQPATNYRVPKSVLKSKSATLKWILDQENAGRKEKGLPLVTMTDIQITKPVTGEGSFTENLELYNKGVERKALALAKTDASGNKYITRNGVTTKYTTNGEAIAVNDPEDIKKLKTAGFIE